MRSSLRRSLALALCLLVCAGATALSLYGSRIAVWTEDRNRDGRADVWRSYDREGRVSKVAVDTDFDGRSDVQEFYERGVLVRREADRDHDDRLDFVQEFDALTGDLV